MTCPEQHRHTRCPEGYLAWHAWSEKKYRTHEQVRCPGCGRFSIWKRRSVPLTREQVEVAFRGGE